MRNLTVNKHLTLSVPWPREHCLLIVDLTISSDWFTSYLLCNTNKPLNKYLNPNVADYLKMYTVVWVLEVDSYRNSSNKNEKCLNIDTLVSFLTCVKSTKYFFIEEHWYPDNIGPLLISIVRTQTHWYIKISSFVFHRGKVLKKHEGE